MRYLSWDVLLFPQEGTDVKTPLQEFKTKCDIVQDPDYALSPDVFSHPSSEITLNAVTRGLPTVSCYVPSLPWRNPFRVSLHCWAPPEATKATTSLESKDEGVIFEAKVMIDGECAAGIVFNADAHWPQILDTAEPPKDGKRDPLRFPAFHAEMLSQTWVLPHESLGRIKVLIAEGVGRGLPGSMPFQKTRNLVAFSFLHTPLHILEDSGIAWPNPGMFYQMSYPNSNPLSPRKVKNADLDTHAHSPRRGAATSVTGPSANPENTIAPRSLLNGMINPEMLPPPFKAYRHQAGDPFLSQYHYHDSFGGGSEAPFRLNPFQGHTRHASSSGDISMLDAATRSTISDEVMPDYVRQVSPLRRLNRSSLNHSSKSFSPEGYKTHALIASSVIRSRSPPHDRQVSVESLRGPRMHQLFEEFDAQSEHEVSMPEQSQFTELINAMSPRKAPENAIYPPTNTRASSLANTPTTNTRPSVAAEARTSSYSGKSRALSKTSLNLPALNHTQNPSKIAPKSGGSFQRSDYSQPENVDKETRNVQKMSTDLHSASIKGRKENHIEGLSRGHGDKSRDGVSPGSNLIHHDNNAGTPHPPTTNKKRRRITSNTSAVATMAVQEASTTIVPEKPANDDVQTDLSIKINEIDDLTAEGVVTRVPLGSLSNEAQQI